MNGSKGWRWGVALFAMLVIWTIGYGYATSGPSTAPTQTATTAPSDCSLKDPRARHVVVDTAALFANAFGQRFQESVNTSVDGVSNDYVSSGSYFKVTAHFQDGRNKSTTVHVVSVPGRTGGTACEVEGQMEWSGQ